MNNPLRYVARIDIEFTAPFIVGSGERDQEADTAFVSDVNGFPAIPGSSIAGVLRRAFGEEHDKDTTDKLFGYQIGEYGTGSRLSISWAVILDSFGKPVERRSDGEPDDPILRSALAGTIRDHVRITDRGVAADKGKFDERAVMAGHRFRFELLLEGTESDGPHWESLLALIGSGNLRIGGKTRRGFGSFKTVAIYEKVYNLTKNAERDAFLELPVELAGLNGLVKLSGSKSTSPTLSMETTLVPEGFWLIGGGDDDSSEQADKEADICPVFETKIDWTTTPSTEKRFAIVPGTAIKGPLAHRVAFYWNAEEGRFADSDDASKPPLTGEDNPAVQALFGYAKKDETGQRGRLMIDDVYLEQRPTEKYVNHVALDRFTCGPIDGALFTEKAFFKGGIPLKILITEPDKIEPVARLALARALDDLCSCGLAIGSGAGRGNGYCKATKAPVWSDGGKWIQGGTK